MRRLGAVVAALLLGALLGTLMGCTPRQVQLWVVWHAEDPEAAEAYASQPEVVAELAERHHEVEAPTPGDCDSYVGLFVAYGLPAATFRAIAWRESGCNHTRYTDDRDDLGGFLLGINFRTATLRAGWASWCGATLGNIRFDAERQVRCAAEAYRRLGLSPWR
jgi:hypothetical protein